MFVWTYKVLLKNTEILINMFIQHCLRKNT
jgi:hypothetical protein